MAGLHFATRRGQAHLPSNWSPIWLLSGRVHPNGRPETQGPTGSYCEGEGHCFLEGTHQFYLVSVTRIFIYLSFYLFYLFFSVYFFYLSIYSIYFLVYPFTRLSTMWMLEDQYMLPVLNLKNIYWLTPNDTPCE